MIELKSKMQIFVIVLVLILHLHMLPFSYSKTIVKHLPGFSGELPFTLETGYVGVGVQEEVELFYYFVESQSNPRRDPLLLYLTGGPGTSGIIPFLNQIGPLLFEYTNASRTDAKLEVNPYSWTKTANIIFIDLPAGTGFSYVKRWDSSKKNSDSLVVTHAYEFIRKWLIDHPIFLDNPLYITGISYMGLIVPRVVLKIYNGNERGPRPELKLKGLLVVNPLTDKFINFNARTEFAYRVGLIDPELYETAKVHCGGKYVYVNPNNTLCLDSLRLVNDSLHRINVNYILDPVCDAEDPTLICRDTIYSYSNIWANKKSVRQALNIREGTVGNFQFSNSSISALLGKPDSIYYSHDIFSSVNYYKQFVTKNCRAMIINGDHDMTFPYISTERWIKSLKLRVTSPWKPWFIRTQVVGYEKTYSEAKFSLKYATVKGAGHSVAIYKPEESMVIVQKWLASQTNSSKS
ncbi:serine carboxypeptidase-like 1 [Bidens hawaiensis]|uniref:serine carboxypeptidase-like 1 n=1 Tax=Bidens hawaiensis TaxID=980011 RepID=UPI00404A63C9